MIGYLNHPEFDKSEFDKLNLIDERFMVKGRRRDNGELVCGYLVYTGQVVSPFAIADDSVSVGACNDIMGYAHHIDGSTIEAVSAPVLFDGGRDGSETNYGCPNCEAGLNPERGNPEYCRWCGQRLDWSNV